MNHIGLSLILATGFSGSALFAEASEDSARRTWLAFECSTFAELMNDQGIQSTLFEDGLSEGRELLNAIANGKNADGELTEDAPLALLMVMAGPSVDFVMGRNFSEASKRAFDKVVAEDLAGFPLEKNDWVIDHEQRAAKASILFCRSNCSLLE